MCTGVGQARCHHGGCSLWAVWRAETRKPARGKSIFVKTWPLTSHRCVSLSVLKGVAQHTPRHVLLSKACPCHLAHSPRPFSLSFLCFRLSLDRAPCLQNAGLGACSEVHRTASTEQLVHRVSGGWLAQSAASPSAGRSHWSRGGVRRSHRPAVGSRAQHLAGAGRWTRGRGRGEGERGECGKHP